MIGPASMASKLALDVAPAGSLTGPTRHGKLDTVAVDCEFLVIGSGIAGLTCALECSRAGRVVLLTKDRLPESSSSYAQGGIASVWSPEDSFEAQLTSISLYNKLPIPVGADKDGSLCNVVFDFVHGILLFFCPFKGYLLP